MLAILLMRSGLGACSTRPPEQGEVNTIHTLLKEWRGYQHQVAGTIVMGDVNVHHSQWLRFSSQGVCKEGRVLLNTCSRMGLRGKIGKPTRGYNLTDLS
eukprot:4414922-Pyramimonas_sp.AAC.1